MGEHMVRIFRNLPADLGEMDRLLPPSPYSAHSALRRRGIAYDEEYKQSNWATQWEGVLTGLEI